MRDEEHGDEQRSIKVVDRRRFTAEGTVREGAPADVERPPAPTPPPAPAAAAPPGEAPDAAQSDGDGQVDFMGFVAQLATQALASLGALPEGRARGIPVNPEVAREYIDVLVMLRHRTRGNLSAEEAAAMTRLISDLQLQAVQAPPPLPGVPPRL